MMLPTAINRTLALLFAGIFIVVASHYPYHRTVLAPLLLAYILLISWRWRSWLMAIPVLLPICDLAPWSGWFYIEELDLLLLATAAIGYWKMSPSGSSAQLSSMPRYAIAGLTISYLISILMGLTPFSAPGSEISANYLSPYNSLRIGKAWCWFLILLPLLLRSAGADLAGLKRYFLPGMAIGVLIVSLSDLRERMLFPGLLNFSADYRTSAPFSGMHTGGAALDGYLALSTPFAAAFLFAGSDWKKIFFATPAFGLVLYAGLSTFSRGLFAAYVCSATIFGVFHFFRSYSRRPPWRLALTLSTVALLLAAALAWIFVKAGYRGLAAALATLLASYVVSAMPGRRGTNTGLPIGVGAVLAAIFLAVSTLLAHHVQNLPGVMKPPYLLFALSMSILTVSSCTVIVRAPRSANIARGAVLIAFGAMLLALNWITWHWAETAASNASAALVLLAVAFVCANRICRPPLWKLDAGGMTAAITMALVLGLCIPVSFSYYASERLGTVTEDLGTRLHHWRSAAGMMDDSALSTWMGMGMGSFPRTYYWHSEELPPTLRFPVEEKNRYLSLSPGVYSRGYGELLRVLQRIELHPSTPYQLEMDIRRSTNASLVQLSMCERLLLYPQNCIYLPVQLNPTIGRWQHYQIGFNSGIQGSGPWYARPPVQLELAVDGGPGPVDFDNLSLKEGDKQLLLNGAFSSSNDYWFFSSDRYHLPWHIKNLMLNIYFEMGWIGVIFFNLWLATTLFSLRTSCQKKIAIIYGAAIGGFLIVGLFDSLIDVPRLALLFFLMMGAAALRTQHARLPTP